MHVWVTIMLNNIPAEYTPPKASGKNIRESAPSPAMVDTMARKVNDRYEFEALGLSLRMCMMHAFIRDPVRKAVKEAKRMRGVAPNTVSMAAEIAGVVLPGNKIPNCSIRTVNRFMANPVKITNLALRSP